MFGLSSEDILICMRAHRWIAITSMALVLTATLAAPLVGSHASVYFSGLCARWQCALEAKFASHTEGLDYTVYRYRNAWDETSRLIVARTEPFAEPDLRFDFRVAVIAWQLSKGVTPAQLERRLTDLINAGTAAGPARWKFDFARKCARPLADSYPFVPAQTVQVGAVEYGFTCVWTPKHWMLHLFKDKNIIVPFTDEFAGKQIWP